MAGDRVTYLEESFRGEGVREGEEEDIGIYRFPELHGQSVSMFVTFHGTDLIESCQKSAMLTE